MTGHRAVLAVGPAGIERLCCAGPAPAAAAAVLQFFDDPIALHDDAPIRTGELLRAVLAEAGHPGAPVLIHPSWWSRARITRLAAAAPGATLIPRRRLLAAAVAGPSVPVEIGPELVAISTDRIVAEPRLGAPAAVADAVARRCTAVPAPVVLDAPTGVGGADALAGLIAERLPGAVRRVDPVTLARLAAGAARAVRGDPVPAPPSSRSGTGRRAGRYWPAAVAVLLTAGLLVGAGRDGPTPGPDPGGTFLVEGKVALAVPADWVARRITDGPGSARVAVTDPADPQRALQLTQAPAAGTTLADTAAALQTALQRTGEPAVFVDFDPAATVAGRPAITYREVRPAHRVDWTVLLDGGVQIGIGCQAPPGGTAAMRAVCDRAVASARALRRP